MNFANASKLNRKSGVRFGERGAPVDSLRYTASPNKFGVESRGIPHLAKNERDMGHPRFRVGDGVPG
jgi:hypothetical protein